MRFYTCLAFKFRSSSQSAQPPGDQFVTTPALAHVQRLQYQISQRWTYSLLRPQPREGSLTTLLFILPTGIVGLEPKRRRGRHCVPSGFDFLWSVSHFTDLLCSSDKRVSRRDDTVKYKTITTPWGIGNRYLNVDIQIWIGRRSTWRRQRWS